MLFFFISNKSTSRTYGIMTASIHLFKPTLILKKKKKKQLLGIARQLFHDHIKY